MNNRQKKWQRAGPPPNLAPAYRLRITRGDPGYPLGRGMTKGVWPVRLFMTLPAHGFNTRILLLQQLDLLYRLQVCRVCGNVGSLLRLSKLLWETKVSHKSFISTHLFLSCMRYQGVTFSLTNLGPFWVTFSLTVDRKVHIHCKSRVQSRDHRWAPVSDCKLHVSEVSRYLP